MGVGPAPAQPACCVRAHGCSNRDCSVDGSCRANLERERMLEVLVGGGPDNNLWGLPKSRT